MVMDLQKKSIKYQTKLFILISVFIWILTCAFLMLQFTREKEYKVSLLHNNLQLANKEILFDIEDGRPLEKSKIEKYLGQDSLRVTVLDFDGKVLFDTNNENVSENHKSREEIQDALVKGSGYTIHRHSKLDNDTYFYSATKGKNYVVRTALPYTAHLNNELTISYVYLWVIILMAVSLTLISYYATRRVGLSVKYLRDFAEIVDKGEINNFNTSVFNNDELGEISRNIVNLYKNLETTTKERDESYKNLLHEEQEKIRIKHQMTSNINHELKTPVHAIQACLETIVTNKEKLDKEQIVDLVENSYQNIVRLCALMNDIATITNITDAANQIEKRIVKINPILDEIIKETSLLPEKKQMRINVSLPNDLEVNGNKSLIEAIFRNIIHNALEYSGGRDIFVKLMDETDDFYKFRIWDNGIGVAEEHLSRLFERFYRIDDGRSRKLGGTGLGLSIVRNSVAFHGGTIRVESPKNSGLEFTFTIHK